jgi:hypothetical protein
MNPTNLIRWSGLAAMVGGVAFLMLWLLPDHLMKLLRLLGLLPENKTATDNIIYVLLMLGAMAAIAGLHLLQERSYGWAGASASLAAFVGLALLAMTMVVGYGTTGPGGESFMALLSFLSGVGLLAATVGILTLAGVTVVRGPLPWWCGVALLAGSPLSAFLGLVFLGVLGGVAMAPVGLGWVVVGYSVFRAATNRTREPSSQAEA